MISGIWDNKYMQELGIFDHCQEILVLHDELRVKKVRQTAFPSSYNDTTAIEETLEREMMDLFLILEKWSVGRSKIKADRVQKFLSRSMGDK